MVSAANSHGFGKLPYNMDLRNADVLFAMEHVGHPHCAFGELLHTDRP
jgi:hypothetical protein